MKLARLFILINCAILCAILTCFLGNVIAVLPWWFVFSGATILMGAIFWPEVLINVFFFAIPFEILSPYPETSLSLLIGYGLALIAILKIIRQGFSVFFSKKGKWVLLYFMCATASLLYARNIDLSLASVPTLLRSVVMFFVLIILIDKNKLLSSAITSFLIGGFMSFCFNYFLGIGSSIQVKYVAEFTRTAGLFGDPNEYAVIMGVMYSISLSRCFSNKKISYFYLMITAGFIIGIISSFSRTGFIAFVFSSIVIIGLKLFSKNMSIINFRKLVPVILVLVFIIIFFSSEQFSVYMRESIRSPLSFSNVYMRYESVIVGIKEFLYNPFGIGLRNFKLINPFGKVAHNMYLEVLVGLGIVGFIVFIRILMLSFKELNSVYQMETKFLKNYNPDVIGLMGSLMVVLIAGLTLSIENEKYVWVIISFSSIVYRIFKQKNNSLSNLNPPIYSNIRVLKM